MVRINIPQLEEEIRQPMMKIAWRNGSNQLEKSLPNIPMVYSEYYISSAARESTDPMVVQVQEQRVQQHGRQQLVVAQHLEDGLHQLWGDDGQRGGSGSGRGSGSGIEKRNGN